MVAINSAAIARPTSCQVVWISVSISSIISVVIVTSDGAFVGSMGMRFPRSTYEILGAGGKDVSSPSGASAGGLARYGYRSRRRSRTGMEKSINASSIEAFSVCAFRIMIVVMFRVSHTDFSSRQKLAKHRMDFDALASVQIETNLGICQLRRRG